jgi:hypothetical protein
MKTAATVLLSIALAACAAPQPLQTPTGRPEVTISGVTKHQVSDAIVAGALEKGSAVKSVTDYEVVIARRDDNAIGTNLLFGSRYDGVPEVRMHLGMVDVTGGVRVFGRAEVVTNPGSAFERVLDVTDTTGRSIQNSLESLRARFSASETAK